MTQILLAFHCGGEEGAYGDLDLLRSPFLRPERPHITKRRTAHGGSPHHHHEHAAAALAHKHARIGLRAQWRYGITAGLWQVGGVAHSIRTLMCASLRWNFSSSIGILRFFRRPTPFPSCKALSGLILVHLLPAVGAGQVKKGAISRYSWIRSGVSMKMNE